MNAKSFLAKFEVVASKAKWKLDKRGAIRCKDGKRVYCPITFLRREITGKKFRVMFPCTAGWKIGLRKTACHKVTMACDKPLRVLRTYKASVDKGCVKLRKNLLALCGLKETRTKVEKKRWKKK